MRENTNKILLVHFYCSNKNVLSKTARIVIWSSPIAVISSVYSKLVQEMGQFSSFEYVTDNAYFAVKSLVFAALNLYLKIRDSDLVRIDEYYAVISSFRSHLHTLVESNLPLSASEVILPLGLGARIDRSSSLSHLLETTGTSHIFVVSGFHLGLYMSGIGSLFGGWFSRKFLGVVELIFCCAFVLLIGFSYSLLRAGCMFICKVVCTRFLHIQYQPLYALGLTALFLFVLGGVEVFKSVSFQLSFAATLGIILMSQSIIQKKQLFTGIFLAENTALDTSLLAGRGKKTGFSRVYAYILESLLVSLAAWLFTLPLVLHHFGKVSLIGIVATLSVSWLLPFFLATIFLGVSILLLANHSLFLDFLVSVPLQFFSELVRGILNLFNTELFILDYSLDSWLSVAFLYCILLISMNIILKNIDKSSKNNEKIYFLPL